MELKKCKNGHSYDPSITPECPECASMAGHTVPLVGVDMSGGMGWANSDWESPPSWDDHGATGATVPVNGGWDNTGATAPVDGGWGSFDGGQWGGDSVGKTTPIQHETICVNPQVNSWADPNQSRAAGMGFHGADDIGVTMPLNYQNQTSAVRPVTGWLVCVEGAEKGKDYRLHSDMNYIGRSRNNDIVLASDPTVSRDRHAMIAYDSRGKMFFFAPANGASLVRQNGRPVLSTVELKAGDRIEIGEGTYLFVPLCGENFTW